MIREKQDQDQKLQDLVCHKDTCISLTSLGATKVYTIKGNVWVPSQLSARIIYWYHSNLHHPGTLNSLSQSFKWKGMCRQVENHIKICDACQCHKNMEKGHYGQMPLVSSLRDKDPFKKVYVDCTGPWTVHIKNDVTHKLSDYKIHILAMVDATTDWPDLLRTHAATQKCSTFVGSVATPVQIQ